MILDSTVRKLQVVLSEAKTTNDCPVVSSWFDSGATPNGGPSLINTNGVTAVDIVAAPASGYIRQVNEITVWNADTVAHGVTVRYNDNGTTFNIIKATLQAGETLTYSKSLAWRVQDASGNIKSTFGGLAAINLSDYTPKTAWTPVLNFGGAHVGMTFANQLGTYVAIGDKVFIDIQLDLTAKGSSTGNATIDGLPINSENNAGRVQRWYISGFVTGVVTLSPPILAQLTNGSNSLAVITQAAGTQLTDANLSNNSSIRINGFYTR